MKDIEAFLKYLKVLRKDSNYTITSYKNDLLELYDFTTDLRGITTDIAKDYLEYLYAKGLSRNSISRKLSAIRSFYQYLENEEIIRDNYFREVLRRWVSRSPNSE